MATTTATKKRRMNMKKKYREKYTVETEKRYGTVEKWNKSQDREREREKNNIVSLQRKKMAYQFEFVAWFAKNRQMHNSQHNNWAQRDFIVAQKQCGNRTKRVLSVRKVIVNEIAAQLRIDTIHNTIVYELQMKRTNQTKKSEKQTGNFCMCVCVFFNSFFAWRDKARAKWHFMEANEYARRGKIIW